jgi:hypothetical protein
LGCYIRRPRHQHGAEESDIPNHGQQNFQQATLLSQLLAASQVAACLVSVDWPIGYALPYILESGAAPAYRRIPGVEFQRGAAGSVVSTKL